MHRASLADLLRISASVIGRQKGAADARALYEGFQPELEESHQRMLSSQQAPPGGSAVINRQHDASLRQPSSHGVGLLAGRQARPPFELERRLLQAQQLAHHSASSWQDIIPWQPPF